MEKDVIARQMVARNDTQGHSATPLQFDPFQKRTVEKELQNKN
jgi:hypothetical protein